MFQLTAARRRLGASAPILKRNWCFNSQPPEGGWQARLAAVQAVLGFNSQPPEGGWEWREQISFTLTQFQLTAARRRLVPQHTQGGAFLAFQLTAARRRLV